MTKFAGFTVPQYTQIPNQFFSELLPIIEDKSELKVLLTAMRYTFGFHRAEADLSWTFIMRATGLSKNATQRGIDSCLERGTLTVARPHTPVTEASYRIKMVDAVVDEEVSANYLRGSGKLPEEVVANYLRKKEPNKAKRMKRAKSARRSPAEQPPLDPNERAALSPRTGASKTSLMPFQRLQNAVRSPAL